ncbi:hypothetical protein ACE2AJ_11590 [Aquihabitans daechungensis]|uniref:hypothetical protein n=1 Tax=Aquihabitans daechungensis TaxID=1052257 RepID=UPI003BA042FD
MVDVEQQIKAWADASAPTGPPVTATDVIEGRATAPAVIPIGGRPARGRWLATAAAVLAVGAIGIGLALSAGDDGPERIRTNDPTTSTAVATSEPGFVGAVSFDLLGMTATSEDRIGRLEAAQSQRELDELWSAAGLDEASGGMNAFNAPEIDFDEQVVVSITIPDDACPPTLTAFQRDGTSIQPRFVEPQNGCEEPLIPKVFVAALDWASTGDEFLLTFVGLRPEDDTETLLVTRRTATDAVSTTRPVEAVTTTSVEAVTTTSVEEAPRTTDPGRSPSGELTASLDLDGTSVRSGGKLTGTITVVNDTGQPIRGTTCGGYFLGLLANDDYQQEIIRPACASDFTIPEGTSTHPVDAVATYTSCTPSGAENGDHPPCEDDGSIPALPPGKYRLTVDDPQDLVPAIRPVTITVT